MNLHFFLDYTAKRFTNRFYVSNFSTKSGFFANAHGLEPRRVNHELHDRSNRDIQYPYQDVNHLKIINRSSWKFRNFNLESDIGFQHNLRQEKGEYINHGYMPAVIPDSLKLLPELERAFDKYTLTMNLRTSFNLKEMGRLISGISSEYQNNSINGTNFIIPAFETWNNGVFVYWNKYFGKGNYFDAGIRYDHAFIDVKSYYDWFLSPDIRNADTVFVLLQRTADMRRHLNSFSGSLAYRYENDVFRFNLNLGRSFRMPIAKELAANGVNYHFFRFERGNEKLKPETSWQMDAGIAYLDRKWDMRLTPFINYFPNYIYLNPTYEHDLLYGVGNQIFHYTQSRVFRYGGELQIHYNIRKNLIVALSGDYIYAVQLSGDKKGYSLPFSPPASALLNVSYEAKGSDFFKKPYISLDFNAVAAQNNIVPPEEKTPGYQLYHLTFGSDIILGKQKITLRIQLHNLFNVKYFSHTSYYRLINVPEQGRSINIHINIPFEKRIKK